MSTRYQAAGGGEHTLIALDTGDVLSCGKGSHGQLGNATIEQIRDTTSIPSNVSIPERIKRFNEVVVHLAAGHNHSAALSAGGSLFTWGDSKDGRLGHGPLKHNINADSAETFDDDKDENIFSYLTPQPVSFFKSNDRKLKFVACGADHTMCIDDKGGLYTWGLGNYGNLGHGSTKSLLKPKLVEALRESAIVFCAGGSKHSIALSHSGELFTWGHGEKGRLGNGQRSGSLIPLTQHYHYPLLDKEMRIEHLANFATEIFVTISRAIEQIHDGVQWICK
eukprot:g14331.t1